MVAVSLKKKKKRYKEWTMNKKTKLVEVIPRKTYNVLNTVAVRSAIMVTSSA